uniref:Uncharacterized protein n=1 Tax=Glossina pallidipes TaxID=7398 RepID=A0A1A9ZK94_GLOPL
MDLDNSACVPFMCPLKTTNTFTSSAPICLIIKTPPYRAPHYNLLLLLLMLPFVVVVVVVVITTNITNTTNAAAVVTTKTTNTTTWLTRSHKYTIGCHFKLAFIKRRQGAKK